MKIIQKLKKISSLGYWLAFIHTILLSIIFSVSLLMMLIGHTQISAGIGILIYLALSVIEFPIALVMYKLFEIFNLEDANNTIGFFFAFLNFYVLGNLMWYSVGLALQKVIQSIKGLIKKER